MNDFLTDSAEWADTLVPSRRVKIVVSGTDSFALWMAMGDALYHRFLRFSTNRNNYPEYKRITGNGFDEYKTRGGLFLAPDEQDYARDDSDSVYEHFIESAVVENLVHTLEHCNETPRSKGYYYDWLYAIDKLVIFKGVIAILESTVEAPIRKNFIQDADARNIPNIGEAIRNWSDPEKRTLKERIADALSVYQEFRKIESPAGTIDALIAFLVKIGCLVEGQTGDSDLGATQKTLYFAHNALMNYALEETVQSVLSLSHEHKQLLASSLRRAADGCLNENIVYMHLAQSLGKDDKIFRYRDPDQREIGAVIVNRADNVVRLIEVKSKSRIDAKYAVRNEARHLFSSEVLKNISVDGFRVVRVIAYNGETTGITNRDGALVMANIEEMLSSYPNICQFIDQTAERLENENHAAAL